MLYDLDAVVTIAPERERDVSRSVSLLITKLHPIIMSFYSYLPQTLRESPDIATKQ